MKVFIVGELPDALTKPFMQYIRDFDIAHADCHFKVSLGLPNMSVDEMIEALQIDPPFPFQTVIRNPKKED